MTFKDLKNIFYSKLESKTSWGKEEVKKIFSDSFIEYVDKYVDLSKDKEEI